MSADTDQVSVGGDAYLTLRALDQTFALPIEFARSVFKIEGLTRVPQAPSHLVGLSNLRGGIIGVVCLASKLDPDAPALGVGALAVAIELGAETFALAVQEIGEVTHARRRRYIGGEARQSVATGHDGRHYPVGSQASSCP